MGEFKQFLKNSISRAQTFYKHFIIEPVREIDVEVIKPNFISLIAIDICCTVSKRKAIFFCDVLG
jgi:hypothetical protein